MKLLDASFESCGDLQELFQPLSPDLVALQLSSGLLKGRVQAWGFDGFRLNLLTTNQTLFLSGARHPEPCTLALPLDPSEVDGTFKAQGISMPWAGLMGYNRGLIDFDLKLPASPIGNGGDQQCGLGRSPGANGRAADDKTLGDHQSTRSSTTPA